MKTLEAERTKDPKGSLTLIPRIYGDEKVWQLSEVNKLPTDYKGLRRWQLIYVMRDDKLYEWATELGPASDFPYCSEFRLFSFGNDTVDEMRDQALAMRLESIEFQKLLAEHQAESTFKRDYLALMHERGKQRRNESVFGPGFTRQRNGGSK